MSPGTSCCPGCIVLPDPEVADRCLSSSLRSSSFAGVVLGELAALLVDQLLVVAKIVSSSPPMFAMVTWSGSTAPGAPHRSTRRPHRSIPHLMEWTVILMSPETTVVLEARNVRRGLGLRLRLLGRLGLRLRLRLLGRLRGRCLGRLGGHPASGAGFAASLVGIGLGLGLLASLGGAPRWVRLPWRQPVRSDRGPDRWRAGRPKTNTISEPMTMSAMRSLVGLLGRDGLYKAICAGYFVHMLSLRLDDSLPSTGCSGSPDRSSRSIAERRAPSHH